MDEKTTNIIAVILSGMLAIQKVAKILDNNTMADNTEDIVNKFKDIKKRLMADES